MAAKTTSAKKTVDEEMEEFSRRVEPSEDALKRISDKVVELGAMRLRAAEMKERLTQLNTDIYKMEHETLPDMFREVGITSLSVAARGNMPPFEAEVAPYYKASISAEWPEEQRLAAFKCLRDHDLGDLIKAEYSVIFGMKTAKQQQALKSALKKLKLDYTVGESVPWNTLTACVKRMYEAGETLPPLATIGATIGTVVSVKEVKPK